MMRLIHCGVGVIALSAAYACEPSSDCSARLSVSAPSRPGAVVMVDGEPIGVVPIFSACVGEGRHSVELVTSAGQPLKTARLDAIAEDYVITFSDEYPGGAAVMTREDFLRQQRAKRQQSGQVND